MAQQNYQESHSPWSPFKVAIFRMIWIAAVISNVGTWMENVGESWLMTSLTHQPLLIALIQSATSLPVFCLALPSGALADILNRRRYLIVLQSGMALTAAALTVVTYLDIVTPLSLLVLTFLIGILTALFMPTWQATTPELVPRQLLPAAVALNGVAMNVSRVIGPALGGVIITLTGPAFVFALNALSFLGIIVVLLRWRRPVTTTSLPSEHFVSAMRAGMRYVRRSPELHRIIIRTSLFFLFASVVLSLLPLLVRREYGLGPGYYGILLGCLGLGAIICVLFLPRLRRYFTNSQIIFGGNLAFGFNILILSWSDFYPLACSAMIVGGMGWLAVLATLNTMAQLGVSPWVRARALSIYYSAFFGGMALGSMLWGLVATHFSLSTTFSMAGIGLISSAIATRSLRHVDNIDHSPGAQTAAPSLGKEKYDQGPVMVTVEYIIAKEDVDTFVTLMQELRLIRLRENSFFWSLFLDIEREDLFIECFMVDSWLEHLRQHERASLAHKKLQEQLSKFHQGSSPPKVVHYLAFGELNKNNTSLNPTIYP